MNGNAVDQVFAQEDVTKAIGAADRFQWFVTDHQNTTRDLINNNSVVSTHYTYDPFGKVTSGDTSLTNVLYTGRYNDLATGLQYNRNRWYDANTGRWLTQDPIGEVNRRNGTTLGSDGGNPALVDTAFADGPNPYIYAHNNPTNFTDPAWYKSIAKRKLFE